MAATIELEHAIGFSTRVPGGIYAHPSDGSKYVYAAGGCVVIADFNDPHQQEFLRGHDDDISTLSVSPSGNLIASGQQGTNSDVIIWDYASRQIKFRFSEHDHGVNTVAFSHDERLLITIGCKDDSKMIVWDLTTGNIVATKGGICDHLACWGGMAKDIKWRDTDKYLFATAGGGAGSGTTAGQQKVRLWALDPYSGQFSDPKDIKLGAKRDYTCMTFSDNGELLIVGTASSDFQAVNLRAREPKAIGQPTKACVSGNGVRAIMCPRVGASDPIVVVCGGGDGSVTVFEMNTDDGTRSSDDPNTWIDVSGADLGSGNAVVALSLVADGCEVVAATGKGFIYRIQVEAGYRVKGGDSTLLVCENHFGAVTAVGYDARNSERFATASADGTLRIWDANDYTVKMAVVVKEGGPGNRPLCLAYSEDISALLSGWEDGKIRAYEVETGEHLWTIENATTKVKTGKPGHVTALLMSNNLRFVICGGQDGDVRVWEMRTRELVSHLKEHTNSVTDLALFDDDVHAISCSRDRSFLCWDLRQEKRVSNHTQRMGGINAVALSKDQTQVMTVGQEKKITYWDLRETAPVQQVHKAHDGEAVCIAVSNNGDFFATGGTDQAVMLWDYASGACLASGVGHSGCVHQLKFSPDDRQLVSVGNDGCVFVWNVYAADGEGKQ